MRRGRKDDVCVWMGCTILCITNEGSFSISLSHTTFLVTGERNEGSNKKGYHGPTAIQACCLATEQLSPRQDSSVSVLKLRILLGCILILCGRVGTER